MLRPQKKTIMKDQSKNEEQQASLTTQALYQHHIHILHPRNISMSTTNSCIPSPSSKSVTVYQNRARIHLGQRVGSLNVSIRQNCRMCLRDGGACGAKWRRFTLHMFGVGLGERKGAFFNSSHKDVLACFAFASSIHPGSSS